MAAMSSDTSVEPQGAGRRIARRQCAEAVLVVRPASFGYNPETAGSNKMQRPPDSGGGEEALIARKEHDGLIAALMSEGVSVCAVEDTPQPPKTDAVFPNNWVSLHEDGTVVLYPMQAESRRRERRQDVLDAVAARLGFKVTRTVDLTSHEKHGRYLEGTGSMVLDHIERSAYACLSPRTDAVVMGEWCRELGYEPILFSAVDRNGVPLYHTNVMMCIGERLAVVGTEAIVQADRQRVIERLRGAGREVIEIGHTEIEHFAGNMLELGTWDEALGDSRVLVMSEAARHALQPEAFARLSACTDQILAVPIPTIERLGGGSVRCTLAEVFLPA